MKTVMLVFVMVLLSGAAFSQVFKKGNSNRPEYERESPSKVDFYRNTSFLVKRTRGENQFAMMYDLKATRNKYYKSDGTELYNRLLLNTFTLEKRWDKSRNKCY